MNFGKLSKEKRNHLLLVCLVTLAALSGLGFGLVKFQFRSLASLAEKKAASEQKLEKMRDGIKYADRLESEVAKAKEKLEQHEKDMAAGVDLYAWAIRTLGDFKARYKGIDIPKINPNPDVVDVNLLPKFPYKQATFTVSGTAYYYDLGRFVADLENTFPFIRVVNLDIDQAGGTIPKEKEKLAFRMDIVALVKPNPS